MIAMALLLAAALSGCQPGGDEHRPPTRPTVASLVPAATDLLIGMGAAEHLVAVSNYDATRDGTRGLPRVGDYQGTDWEQLTALRPDVMIIQLAEERVPQGMVQRAERLGIRLVNVRINRLEDVFATLEQLGEAIGQPAQAQAAGDTVRAQLQAVQQRVASREPVTALIVLDEAGRHVAGPENFLDDLLRLAGGVNAAQRLGHPWPSIDREMLMDLQPEVILQLLPDASPQVLQRAQRTWAPLTQLPAARDGRIHSFTGWYVLQPGLHVGQLAEQFAAALHPID